MYYKQLLTILPLAGADLGTGLECGGQVQHHQSRHYRPPVHYALADFQARIWRIFCDNLTFRLYIFIITFISLCSQLSGQLGW